MANDPAPIDDIAPADDIANKLPELTVDAFRDFLRNAPLYSRWRFRSTDGYISSDSGPSSLNLPCSTCREPVTTHRIIQRIQVRVAQDATRGMMLTYRCGHCAVADVVYWLDSSSKGSHPAYQLKIQKIGQYPPPTVDPPKALRKALTDAQLDFYSKGMRNLQGGYGLGAVAYFRRLIEDAGNQFLELVADAARSEGDDDRAKQAEDAIKGRQVDSKLELAADLMPASLCIGGMNPLKIMYGRLSEGLHGKDDDACVEVAQSLRKSFEYVFVQLRDRLEESKKFRAEMGKL